MNTVTDSILDRLGISDEDSMPINPIIVWDHEYPEETLTIVSGLSPIDRDEYDSMTQYDISFFGDEADEEEPLTDDEWTDLIASLDLDDPIYRRRDEA